VIHLALDGVIKSIWRQAEILRFRVGINNAKPEKDNEPSWLRDLAHRGWLSFSSICPVADFYQSGDGGRESRGNSAIANLFAAVGGRAASGTAFGYAQDSW
jgi:hypothetical protein